jgi:hypothetical protein
MPNGRRKDGLYARFEARKVFVGGLKLLQVSFLSETEGYGRKS